MKIGMDRGLFGKFNKNENIKNKIVNTIINLDKKITFEILNVLMIC